MGELIEISNFEVCSICHKRPAEFLCDMPTGTAKNFHLKLPNGLTDYNNSFKEYTVTCDRAVCEKCAIEVNKGIHFCENCLQKIKDKLQY